MNTKNRTGSLLGQGLLAVVNGGEIQAQGGRVLLTASVSHDVFSRAVNIT